MKDRNASVWLRIVGRVGSWDPAAPGVLRLPSGRLVRGRGLRAGLPAGAEPQFGVYLQSRQPAATPWAQCWVRWRDWWLPSDFAEARAAIEKLHERAVEERVEVACTGGRGRTGTVLACLAVLDGVPAVKAVAYVRSHYHRRAVETPWQRLYVRRFQPCTRLTDTRGERYGDELAEVHPSRPAEEAVPGGVRLRPSGSGSGSRPTEECSRTPALGSPPPSG